MCSLILLRYQNNNNSAGIEAGIQGAPDSITADSITARDGVDDTADSVDDTVDSLDDTVDSVDDRVLEALEDIGDKLEKIVEKVEDKVDETETVENEEINEIKDILNAINEKEINIDEEIKVSDDKNEEILLELQGISSDVQEILFEVRETKDIILENIEVAKEFVGIGFGVILGVVVGYTIMRFLGR